MMPHRFLVTVLMFWVLWLSLLLATMTKMTVGLPVNGSSEHDYRQLYEKLHEEQTSDVDWSAKSTGTGRTAAISVELTSLYNDDDDDDDNEDDDGEINNDGGSGNYRRKNVQLVTRGSAIVFLDNIPQQANINDTDTSHQLASTSSDEVKITSVSQTSSKERSENMRTKSEHSADSDTTTTTDSMNEASSHFETILQAPPDTIIVHDPDFHKDGAARPRSVSYSSVAQTVVTSVATADTRMEMTRYARNTTKPDDASMVRQLRNRHTEHVPHLSEPAKVYGEPARVYSEPAKVYSEPAKVYSVPSKVYSEPAQNYGVPAKVYSEPSKVYSLPAGSENSPRFTTTTTESPSDLTTVSTTSRITTTPTTTTKSTSIPSALIENPASTSFHFGVHNVPQSKRIIFNLDKLPYDLLNAPENLDNDNGNTNRAPPPKNYLFAPQLDSQRFHQFARKTHGQQFGALPSLSGAEAIIPRTESMAGQDTDITDMGGPIESSDSGAGPQTRPDDSPDPKVGFVVEGRNYRKYRVEEKTPDGFIVGEYGVVSNNDGTLRGVRYTADSNISPNLIYETLMKFLSL